VNGAHLAGVLGEFADAVQSGLGGVVEGVDDDDAEALQEPALLLLLVRCRRSFSSWSGAGAPSPPGDGFERRLGLGLRAAARVSGGG
jgi:hypothetical protein